MRPLEVEDGGLMTIAIQQEIRRSEEARYDHRLHGVLLVGQGMHCYEVGQLLGQDPVTVQRWVNQFNQRGFAGLQEGERPGRPGCLSGAQWAALGQDLRRSPRDLGHAQN
jgi:transposase